MFAVFSKNNNESKLFNNNLTNRGQLEEIRETR